VTTGERLAAHGLTLPPGHTLLSVEERPDLWRPIGDLNVSLWPEFMLNDPVANEYWERLLEDFPAFQLALFDARGDIVAANNAAPLAWDGTDGGLPDGWDDQFLRSVAGHEAGTPPDVLGALQITVHRDRQGSGYSGVMVNAMRANAASRGYRAVIACVRPTDKVRYPLIPIEAYAGWMREDGLPFDPWIRLHVRLGGRIVRTSPASMRIVGTVAEWREWTGLELPGSGEYLPDGAAAPVAIDLAADRGVYLDPNVWVVHALGQAAEGSGSG
jgi:GNAT superfamily N-acetyltransferase